MTRVEAINFLQDRIRLIDKYYPDVKDYRDALKMAIKALEQEPTKDEVILTKKEYGELVSSEYDNGYATGYSEALEQEPILDKIRAEIMKLDDINPDYPMDRTIHISRNEVLEIIDKYRQEE